MLKLSLTIASAVGLLATLIATPALADCDSYEAHVSGHGGIVPEWSYAHSFRSEVPLLDKCARESEALACDQGEEGLECAEDMQQVYVTCVADSLCDDWTQGQLEDGELTDGNVGEAYRACIGFVVAAGGSGR